MKNIFNRILLPIIFISVILISSGIVTTAESATEIETGLVTETESEAETGISPDNETELLMSKLGDMNGDNKRSAADARIILRCAAELEIITEDILTYGDYNSDGQITSADSRIALRVAAHLDSIECILSGHEFRTFIVEPDCTNDGYTTGKCVRCTASDETKTDGVPAKGHDFDIKKTAPTCTSSGWITVICKECNYVETDRKDGEPVGHNMSEWVQEGNTNRKTRTCTDCDYSELSKVQNSKIVYLTFDDGPGAYTEKLLGYLRDYDVKATFFVTNQFPAYIYNLKTMADDGHAIGVHTLTHSWDIYSSESAYMKDFNDMHDIIRNQTGIDTKIFRFPGGTNNTVSRSYSRGIMTTLATKMADSGYYSFDWNVDCYDTSGYGSSKIASSTISQIKSRDESIVLMHDIKKATVDAIPEIIEYCLANGYVFEVLDENSPAIRFSPAN